MESACGFIWDQFSERKQSLSRKSENEQPELFLEKKKRNEQKKKNEKKNFKKVSKDWKGFFDSC